MNRKSVRYKSVPVVSRIQIMNALKSIRILDQDKIDIVNQLLLPHTIEYVQIQTIEQAHDAIKSMKVRPSLV